MVLPLTRSRGEVGVGEGLAGCVDVGVLEAEVEADAELAAAFLLSSFSFSLSRLSLRLSLPLLSPRGDFVWPSFPDALDVVRLGGGVDGHGVVGRGETLASVELEGAVVDGCCEPITLIGTVGSAPVFEAEGEFVFTFEEGGVSFGCFSGRDLGGSGLGGLCGVGGRRGLGINWRARGVFAVRSVPSPGSPSCSCVGVAPRWNDSDGTFDCEVVRPACPLG